MDKDREHMKRIIGEKQSVQLTFTIFKLKE
jgi:hypothetical protein